VKIQIQTTGKNTDKNNIQKFSYKQQVKIKTTGKNTDKNNR
jgi:hypothetical protein